MLINYFRIAWRNINKYRLYSFINIGGLAIGIATFWMIALYVSDEWSYDRSNIKGDRVFRVAQHGKFGNTNYNLAITPVPFGPALKADYPEVEDVARIDPEGGGKIINDGKKLDVGDISCTDNAIFNLFTYRFISGDPTTALGQPKSIVLTEVSPKGIRLPGGSSGTDDPVRWRRDRQHHRRDRRRPGEFHIPVQCASIF